MMMMGTIVLGTTRKEAYLFSYFFTIAVGKPVGFRVLMIPLPPLEAQGWSSSGSLSLGRVLYSLLLSASALRVVVALCILCNGPVLVTCFHHESYTL